MPSTTVPVTRASRRLLWGEPTSRQTGLLRFPLKQLKIDVTRSRKGRPTDKPNVERLYQSIHTMFAESLPGYVGYNTERRAKEVDKSVTILTLDELRAVFTVFVLMVYQRRPHSEITVLGHTTGVTHALSNVKRHSSTAPMFGELASGHLNGSPSVAGVHTSMLNVLDPVTNPDHAADMQAWRNLAHPDHVPSDTPTYEPGEPPLDDLDRFDDGMDPFFNPELADQDAPESETTTTTPNEIPDLEIMP